MRNDENGYIVVETIGCFILFVFLNLSILSLINIVTVQARVHYALTQAAETLSMYSYTLDAMGVAEHLMNSAERAEKTVDEANEMIGNINDVIAAIESIDPSAAMEAGQATYNQGKNIVEQAKDDPMDILQNFMNYGIQEGGSALFGTLIRPLVGRYLSNGEVSGNEYLVAFHVIGGLDGVDFYTFDLVDYDIEKNSLTTISNNDSKFLTSSGNIKLVAQYEIDYTFGALPLPFTKLHVTQEVMTKAWLGGHGEGYSP